MPKIISWSVHYMLVNEVVPKCRVFAVNRKKRCAHTRGDTFTDKYEICVFVCICIFTCVVHLGDDVPIDMAGQRDCSLGLPWSRYEGKGVNMGVFWSVEV